MNTESCCARLRLPLLLLLLLGALLSAYPPQSLAQAPPGGRSHPGKSQPKEKPYALIFGTVYGPDDRAAYGVKVKIRRANEKKAKWELYSDHQGEFAQRVPAGEADYIVWADVKTAKGSSPPEVKVHVINDERQDIGLHLTK
ncbi:MAG: hypothetical protein DMG67_03685 [Acidobacteria bacterium]|nr:MAG: hypothetical protein DMG67_03685 [Acidobacteriota bacterium]